MSSDVRQPLASPLIGVLEGGTDIASMVIFDPAGLPEDYDSRARDDPIVVIERLAAEQGLYWLYTAADGGYTFGVCLGGDLPSETARFAKHVGDAAHFAAPSGRLYFTGLEYAFRHDDYRLRKYPHMGACQEIPPGVYCLALYEMDYPEGLHEDLLRRRLSASAFRAYSLMDRLGRIGGLSLLVLAASFFGFSSHLWSITALPICLVLVLLPIAVSRTQTYRDAKLVDHALKREFPDYLATLVGANRD